MLMATAPCAAAIPTACACQSTIGAVSNAYSHGAVRDADAAVLPPPCDPLRRSSHSSC